MLVLVMLFWEWLLLELMLMGKGEYIFEMDGWFLVVCVDVVSIDNSLV